ncbi:type III secretion apparatus assembly protein SctX [Halodesulfovibrio marinisediminis]|uniref:Type III secretion system YscX (Type_III_YscX) n=1 Tax=Halodesulfovibrio marinisediminis DSM 17456 TaxID=1121457 RepID=A0A1N6I8P3_9BACT|nr:hypothetical protein [Halodesulfovibrio marinisediminis]SIO28370.1 Type III secretion system YscX (type_III_YscX) [Halodesulfovibrio marinisediminis DSM 17456]
MSTEIKPSITFNHGIEQVSAAVTSKAEMPKATNVPPHLASSFCSLEEVFKHKSVEIEVEAFLTPSVSDPALLLPENFGRELRSALQQVSEQISSEAERGLAQELDEAVNNQQFLQMYKNLVVAG